MSGCELSEKEQASHVQAYNHALFENMAFYMDAVWEMNLDTGIVYIMYDKLNPAFKGTTMNLEALRDFLCSSVHTDDIAELIQLMSVERLSALTETETYKSKSLVDGHFRTIFGVATPCRGEDGKVHEVYFSFKDVQEEIDERARLVEQIGDAESTVENQVSDTLEGAKIGMWRLFIEKGKKPAVYLDKMAEELVGAPSELTPEERFTFLNEHVDEGSRWRLDLYQKNMLSGKNDEIIYPYHHPALGTISIRCGGRLDASYKGPGILLRGYHQDISEHEAEIRSLNEELNRYLSAVNCGITQYSLDMKHIIFVNDIALKTLGYSSREEMEADLDGGVVGNVSEKEAKRIRHITSRIKSPRDVADFEFSITHKDGRELTCFGSIRLIERPGEEPIIQRSIIDITEARDSQRLYTETKDAYDKLREYQGALKEALTKAEVANKSKTVFLSNMSHDIRTPMNAIIGFTDLALAHMDDTGKVMDYLNKIKASSNHLLSLINDVLVMSHIESGRIELQENENSLKEIAEALSGLLSAEVNQKNQKFFLDTNGICDDRVWCDRLRLNRVLLNCLGNSVKFTPEGGSISLKINQITHSDEESDTYSFSISDTGIGMSPEFLTRMFEPFERERSTTVSGITGTGLGMSISKNIVEMMGGTIEVASEQGKGTVFTITLKLRKSGKPEIRNNTVPANTSERGGAQSEKRSLSGVKILLVEDNDLNREIASEILRDEDIFVYSAVDGKEAYEKVAASKPGDYDLILMDIQMPVMDGYTATRNIRMLPDKRLADIPIVAMTANAFQEDKRMAFDAGMDGHVAKPIVYTELFDAIRSNIKR